MNYSSTGAGFDFESEFRTFTISIPALSLELGQLAVGLSNMEMCLLGEFFVAIGLPVLVVCL